MSPHEKFPELEQDTGGNVGVVTRIDETYWGYIVRTVSRPSFAIVAAQALSGVFGLSLVAAAVGFWALPGALLSGDVVIFKAVASAMLLSAGIFLLWYASAGTQPETQIDHELREVREVMRNAKGHTRLVSRYGFGEIAGVFVQSDPEDPIMARLVLAPSGGRPAIVAAHAPEHQLSVLRGRIAKDLRRSAAEPRQAGARRARAPEALCRKGAPEDRGAANAS